MHLTDAELRNLYTRYAHVLLRRAEAALAHPEEADPVVRAAFSRILKNPEDFRDQPSALVSLYRISTRLILDRAPLPELLEGRDETDRVIALHRLVDGCTDDEVAELMGMESSELSHRLRDAPAAQGPSRLRLDRFATGELEGAQRREVQRQLQGDAGSQAHLEALRDAQKKCPSLDIEALRSWSGVPAPTRVVQKAPEPLEPEEPDTVPFAEPRAFFPEEEEEGELAGTPTPEPAQPVRRSPEPPIEAPAESVASRNWRVPALLVAILIAAIAAVLLGM